VKLATLKGDASREGNFFLYCIPSCLPAGRDPTLRVGERDTCQSGAWAEFSNPDQKTQTYFRRDLSFVH